MAASLTDELLAQADRLEEMAEELRSLAQMVPEATLTFKITGRVYDCGRSVCPLPIGHELCCHHGGRSSTG